MNNRLGACRPPAQPVVQGMTDEEDAVAELARLDALIAQFEGVDPERKVMVEAGLLVELLWTTRDQLAFAFEL